MTVRTPRPPEEIAERLAEAEATAAAEREASRVLHRDELWEKVKRLAKDPRLLDRMVRFIEDRGIVGERAGILAIYLAMTSRLHRRKAMSLLRRGASAAGKNAPIEEVLKLFPPDAIYEMTDGSAKSLVFYGGADDVDALKGKVIYIHEAAAIAPKRGEEDDKARFVRMLISEGRIVYPISQIDPETNEIRTQHLHQERSDRGHRDLCTQQRRAGDAYAASGLRRGRNHGADGPHPLRDLAARVRRVATTARAGIER